MLVFAINSAANIQKAAREYLLELEEKFAVDLIPMSDCDETEHINEVRDDVIDIHTKVDYPDSEEDTQAVDVTTPVELIPSLPQDMIGNSFKISCVAHQLQLAINTFSEYPEISELLEAARRLSAKLRTPMIKRRLDIE